MAVKIFCHPILTNSPLVQDIQPSASQVNHSTRVTVTGSRPSPRAAVILTTWLTHSVYEHANNSYWISAFWLVFVYWLSSYSCFWQSWTPRGCSVSCMSLRWSALPGLYTRFGCLVTRRISDSCYCPPRQEWLIQSQLIHPLDDHITFVVPF